MADVTRAHGGVNAPLEQVGRDLEFISVTLTGIHTGFASLDSDFEKVVKVIQKTASITIIGLPAADDVIFGVEGLSASAAVITTDIDAATGGSSTVALVVISGDVFA